MKTTGTSYILWLLLGGIGAHKFYLGKTGMGILYLSLAFLGAVTWLFFMGWLFHIPLLILLLIDLFTIPSQVAKANERAAVQMADFQKKVEQAKENQG